MAPLEAAVATALQAAEKLKATKAAGNEANTRALLIDPVLGALGWNLLDISEVEREYRVFDGTFLDYALRLNGKPRLFVEAKALNKSLSDKPFIAQTVNYANNEGVLWCVLTNGLEYRVYKSNEPVDMERKLLFQVNLNDAAEQQEKSTVLQSLRKLSKDALESGELDTWGEEVFTDVRVRSALAKLGATSPSQFLSVVASEVEGAEIEPKRLKASLSRILGSISDHPDVTPVVGTAPGKPESPKKQVWPLERHTANKPQGILDLFERLDAFGTGLGPDVERRVLKYYIGYFAGKRSFFTMELQKAKINVYLSLDPAQVKPWNSDAMRDVTKIGHFGLGNTEYALQSTDQLSELEALIKDSYLKNRR